jgi:hypothetical protein
MDFIVFDIHLAAKLDVSLYELSQRRRTLRLETNALVKQAMKARAGRKQDDSATLAKRAAATIPDKQAATLLAGFDAAMSLPSYNGKRGPGGGIKVDPGLAASFLTAMLVGGQHKGIAKRALDISFANYVAPPDCAYPICPVTGQLYFGDAFTTILTDRLAFDRAVAVTASEDRGVAEISFTPEHVSRFVIPGKANPNRLFFRENILVIRGLPWLYDACNSVDAPVREMAPA